MAQVSRHSITNRVLIEKNMTEEKISLKKEIEEGFAYFLARRDKANFLPQANVEELRLVYTEGFLRASDLLIRIQRGMFDELRSTLQ